MRGLLQAAVIWALALGGAAQAGEPVVIELYTSQGCSSCPPADKLLGELVGRDDVLPLALHVDYWDYIGWKDEFARPQHTKRQKGYARAAGQRSIYTPQMIVGGRDHVVGYKPMKLADAIARHKERTAPLELRVNRSGGKLKVWARPTGRLPRDMKVQLVRYRPSATVAIKRGENAGKTITYHNIVTDWRTVADWDGRDELNLALDVPGSDKVAVLVQADGYGPILAAAQP